MAAIVTLTPPAQRNSNKARTCALLRRKDGTTLLRLTINGKVTTYTLWRTRQGYRLEYYDLGKHAVKAYHVTIDDDPRSRTPGAPLFCDCPDCTFRNRACKHMLALEAVLAQAEKE